MSGEEERAALLRGDLSGAVARGEIEAVFQPQFSLTDSRIVSAEALCRWRHPVLGYVSPAEFIPVAEEAGLIDEIGAHMLRLGCEAAARWSDRDDPLEVAVNVSLLQLAKPNFVSRVRESITAAAIAPALLVLEITESTELSDVPTAVDTARALAGLGVTISIDDFGSGFSSEQQVGALPALELKIDQKLVQAEGEASVEEFRNAIAFGRSMGMRTVAEGVETAAQLDRARELGCDRAQGYLLGRPMPSDEIDQRLLV